MKTSEDTYHLLFRGLGQQFCEGHGVVSCHSVSLVVFLCSL